MSFTTRRLSGEGSLPPSTGQEIKIGIKASKGFFGWYKKWKERKKEEETNSRRMRILKKICIILVAILLASILLAGTVRALIALQIITPRRILSITAGDLQKDEDGYINFLLLGSGDKSHDGVDLTDTMMIASIDPTKTHSAVLLSLPRDLYAMNTEKMGKGRINALYRDYKSYLRQKGLSAEDASREALKELSRELGKKLGITIQYTVKVDFIAFVKAVDTLGGIDIDVPYDIVDTEYPGPNYTYQTFSITAGPQHIDGETALKYARSRHTTSDFDRSARQQQILKALAEKAKEEGLFSSPGKLLSLFKILSENVESTMNFSEILGTAKLGEEVDKQHIISVHLNNEVGFGALMPSPGGFLYNPPMAQFNGASVLLPEVVGTEPMGSWRQLRSFSYLLLKKRATYLSAPQIFIRNAGAKSGLGRMLGFELSRYGFPVSDIDNLNENPSDEATKWPTSHILYKVEADRGAAEFFASLLHIEASMAPPSIPVEKLGQITIVLGKDYVYEPIQSLVPAAEERTLYSTPSTSGAVVPTTTDPTASLMSPALPSSSPSSR
jgi:LCP family protein required for cell wall assembly